MNGVQPHQQPARGRESAGRSLGTALQSNLGMVTAQETQDLLSYILKGRIPLDLESKLASLASGDVTRCFIERQCRIIIDLLIANQTASFADITRAEFEHFLRVLAYIRKEDDALPDCRPDGFTDDKLEIRALLDELGPRLQAFKDWRLRYQVPGMWSRESGTA